MRTLMSVLGVVVAFVTVSGCVTDREAVREALNRAEILLDQMEAELANARQLLDESETGLSGSTPKADPLPLPLDADDAQHVGIDQAAFRLDLLPSVDKRGAIGVLYGLLRDGAGRETLADYLSDALPEYTVRYPTAPEVRIDAAATDYEKAIFHDAV